MFDLAVNVAMLALDAALLAVLWKKRDAKWFAILLGAGVAAVFLGAFLSLFVVGLFGAMRAVAWAIFLHGIVLLAGCAALLWKPHRKIAAGAGAAALIIALIGLDAFFLEPHRLEVTRLKISSPKLTRALKIVILADLQTDEIGVYERAVLKLAKSEKPDLVLFAGDYIQEHDDARRALLTRELKKALKEAGFGDLKAAIAVEGNCDSPDWPAGFEGTGIAWTRETRTVREGAFQITALSLDDSFNTRLAVEESNLFHIAVGHAPDFALGDVRADLLVAGHTHGGQVRLPGIGPLITLSQVPRSWAAGKTELSGGRTLVVSRGIGMERGRAPRLRFLCRPELVIVEALPGQ